jgi:hypothetical protein
MGAYFMIIAMLLLVISPLLIPLAVSAVNGIRIISNRAATSGRRPIFVSAPVGALSPAN